MASPQRQRGNTFVGFIAGLILGLVISLCVAVYISKVPMPFMSKSINRSSPEHDAAEEQKNKDWDPNAPLYGKSPVRPAVVGDKPDVDASKPNNAKSVEAKPAETKPTEAKPAETRPVEAKPKDVAAKVDPRSADPLGDLAKAAAKPTEAKSEAKVPAKATPDAQAGADPFLYYVQAGAFRTTDEAESQRAQLLILGLEAKVSEREQGGRSVYRVRVGPFNEKGAAERVHEKLESARIDSAMVRVQR